MGNWSEVMSLVPEALRIVNVCPHPLDLIGDNGVITTLWPCGVVTRLEEKRQTIARLSSREGASYPVTEVTLGKLVDLPEPVRGVLYWASTYCADAAVHEGRPDVVAAGSFEREAGFAPETINSALNALNGVLTPAELKAVETALRGAQGRIRGAKGIVSKFPDFPQALLGLWENTPPQRELPPALSEKAVSGLFFA